MRKESASDVGWCFPMFLQTTWCQTVQVVYLFTSGVNFGIQQTNEIACDLHCTSNAVHCGLGVRSFFNVGSFKICVFTMCSWECCVLQLQFFVLEKPFIPTVKPSPSQCTTSNSETAVSSNLPPHPASHVWNVQFQLACANFN